MRRATWIAVLTTLTLLAAGACGGDAGTDPGTGADLPATDEGTTDTPEPVDPGAPPDDATDPGPGDPGMPPDDVADPGPVDPGIEDPGLQDPGTPPDDVADPGPADPGIEDPGAQDPGAEDPGTPPEDASDPGSPDPGSQDPGSSDPGPSDPGPSDPGSSDPGEPQAELDLHVIQDTLDGEVPVGGVTVTLLSNEDGTPLGASAVSDSAGLATLAVPRDRPFGLRLSRNDSMDTYYFDLVAQEQPVEIAILSNALATAILDLLGVDQDPAKGVAAGHVLFRPDVNPYDGIGCATVSSTPAGQVFYFDEDGPVGPETRASTGKQLPDFLAFNLPAGAVAFEARVGGEVVATGTGRVFPGGITFSVVVASDAASNPTPVDCTL